MCGGSLPFCEEELLRVSLAALPETGGLHFLQLKNASGLFSNDMMFFVEQQLAPSPGNLIESGGTFSNEFNDHWNTVELVTDSISVVSGEVLVAVRRRQWTLGEPAKSLDYGSGRTNLYYLLRGKSRGSARDDSLC